VKFFGIILGCKNAQFNSGLDQSEARVKKFKAVASGAFGGELGKKLAGYFGGVAIAGALKGIVDRADEIADLADRFQVPTDALQKMGLVAEKNGSSLEGVAMAYNKLAINQDKALAGSDEMRQNFEDLGISMADLQSLSPDQLMEKIGQGSMHASSLVGALGKSALELVPTLEQLKGASVHGIISEDEVKRLSDFKDQATEIGRVLQTWGAFIANGLIAQLQRAGALAAAIYGGFESMVKGEGFMKGFAGPAAEVVFGEPKSAAKKPRPRRDGEGGDAASRRFGQAVEAEKKAYERLEEEQLKAQDKKSLAALEASKKRQGMSGSEIAQMRRDAHREAREQRKAEREFTKKYLHGDKEAGKQYFQELRDRQDPVKQAEKAWKSAMAKSESLLGEIADGIDEVKDALTAPTN
jgi:hypothetical protein